MGQTNRGVRRIDTLASVTRSTHDINPAVLILDYHVHILRLWHNRHSRCGSVDTSAALRLRNTLNTVNTALVFQLGIGSFSCDHSHDLLETADSVFIDTDQLHFPVLALRIVHIHTVQLSRKQSGLISARAGTDFQNDVLVIIGVLGKKKYLKFLLQRFDLLLCIG